MNVHFHLVLVSGLALLCGSGECILLERLRGIIHGAITRITEPHIHYPVPFPEEGRVFFASAPRVCPEGYRMDYSGNCQSAFRFSRKRSQSQNNGDGGAIIFPDNLALNPTPETERDFGEGSDSDPKTSPETPVVNPDDIVNRSIFEHVPLKKCETGKILDKKTKQCKTLARK